MNTINQLIEQTQFLMQQQLEAHKECTSDFSSLLEFIETKKNDAADEDSKKILSSVQASMAQQSAELDKNMREDLAFLQEQLKALEQVAAVQDPVRKAELSRLLLEDVGELQSTENFKKEVLAEAEENRKGLKNMIGDVRSALEEGGAAELEMLFEAMQEQAELTGDHEEENEDSCCRNQCDDGEEDHGLEASCCSSEESEEEGCCGGGMKFDDADEEEEEGVNIYEHIEKATELKAKAEASVQKTAAVKDECCGGVRDCGDKCLCDNKCGCA